jgi:hypothetical protein
VRLAHPLTGRTTSLPENCRLEIQVMNLGGGAAACDRSLPLGTLIAIRLTAMLQSIRAQAFVRAADAETKAFEIADIELEERAKLRRLLAQLGGVLSASAQNRSRTRTSGK